jgi:hypothetical protein
VNLWITLGVFLLGAGAGAVTTAAMYSAQVRRLRQLVEAISHHDSQAAKQADGSPEHERKSA